MKNTLFILILLAAGCSKKPEAVVESPKPEAPKEAPAMNTTPVEYVSSLQKDADKANSVKDKANAAIQSNVQALEQAEKDSSGQ